MAEKGKRGAPPEQHQDGVDVLTAEQLKAAEAWFVEKLGPNKACPMCGHPHWMIGTELGAVPTRSATPMSARHYTTVTLMCQRCGFTAFFNAIAQGFVEPSPPEKEG